MTTNIQSVGRSLSKMVMPNISVFIAWGILTTLFHPNGWFPNEAIAVLIQPMIVYAIPILIAYTGGTLLHAKKGGVVAVVAILGLIASNDQPMLLGAMVLGPLCGYLVLRLERLQSLYTPSGFEMLLSNFSTGLLAMLLAIFSLYVLGPLLEGLNVALAVAVTFVLDHGFLFLSAIFIEPAKIMFLNNAINHGVLSPLGIADSLVSGKSILYLLETNPGPGLGVLIGYWFYGKRSIKTTIPGASIIHLLGGIHEIYFPYVLMQPYLILALVGGGLTGNLIFQRFQVGLTATPSPGSLFAILALSPKSDLIWVLLGVIGSFLVSCLIACVILRAKRFVKENDKPLLEVIGGERVDAIFQIHFVCDAGMGSSAMGASLFEKKIDHFCEVVHCSIDELPEDAHCIVTYVGLLDRIKKRHSEALLIGLSDFLEPSQYDALYALVKCKAIMKKERIMNSPINKVLLKNNIVLSKPSLSKREAIVHAGQMLVDSGYVDEAYIEGMLAREEKFSTYIGNHVAIPHGENSVKDHILKSGIVVVQYPDGIDFGEGKLVKLIIGIAGKGNEHIEILANVAEAIEDEAILSKMLSTQEPDFIYQLFSQKE